MGVEGALPTEQEISDIRTLVNDRVDDMGLENIDVSCLHKIRTDDVYLTKFFIHTFDHPGRQTDAAVNMIINTLKWRKEFGAESLSESDFPQSLLEKGSLFSHNRDIDGRKLLVFVVGKHYKGAEKMEDMKRFFVYHLERLNREERGEQITVMFDCKGAGLKNMDMEFVQFLIGCMKEYYPDPLNYILVYDMPWVLNAAFKIIKGWLPPAAVKKIKFVTKSNMGEYITEDNRLSEWGGSDEWQYRWESENTDIVRENLNEDVKDRSKRKSVTFASSSPDVLQSPQDSLGSASSQFVGGLNNNLGQTDILKLNPGQEVVFVTTLTGDLVGKVLIQNISLKIVGYKIKTTSPEKYRVRPSTGSLSPGGTAAVEIYVTGGSLTSQASNLLRDKFLITAVFLESAELSQTQLADALKTVSPDGQYRLRCQLASSGDKVDSNGVHSTQCSDVDSTTQVNKIFNKVSQMEGRQEEIFMQLRRIFHVELVLLVLVTILILMSLYKSNTGDCSKCIEDLVKTTRKLNSGNEVDADLVSSEL